MTHCVSFSRTGASVVLAAVLALAACAETELAVHTVKEIADVEAPAVEKPLGVYKVGKPYQVNGVWYYPGVDYGYSETGIASWYGEEFHGKPTANGEVFDMNAVTAAHKTLPLPSLARVTNLENGRSLIVRVNDRGPFVNGRIIDLSRRSAQLLGFARNGTAKVRVDILPDESRRLAMALPRVPGEEAPGPEVKAAPRIEVAAQELPPPGAVDGMPPAPEPKVALHSEEWPTVARPEAVAEEYLAPPEPRLTQEPVRPTQTYIQVGAFRRYDNAHRLRARLSVLGSVTVTPVELAEGQRMFRVRLGPVDTVDEVDRLLERLLHGGYTDSRVVVVQ